MWMKLLMNKFFIITMLVVVFLIAIYFWGRSAGKKAATGTQAKLPNNGKGIPINWNPTPTVEKVHKAFNDYFTSALDKQTAFQSLLSLTNDQLIAVYNEFNRKYQGGVKGDTLLQWVKDEWITRDITSPLGIFATDLKADVIKKFEALNLK